MSDHQETTATRSLEGDPRPISRRTFVATAAAAGAALTIGPRDLLARGCDPPPSSLPPASPPPPVASAAQTVTLRYRRPAEDFSQALPIGAGRLGAMVYGGVPRDRLSLNHSGLWRRHHRNTTVAVSAHLAEIRRLARAGHWREAEQRCLETLQPYVPELHAIWSKTSGVTPERTINAYQPAGNLVIAVPDGPAADDYERALDLATGIATVRYRVGDVQFTREYFCVATPSVIVARLTASRRGALHCTIGIDRGRKDGRFRQISRGRAIVGDGLDPDCALEIAAKASALELTGRFVEGATWAVQTRVLATGGSVHAEGDRVVVAGADDAWVVTAIVVDTESPDPAAACRAVLRPLAVSDLRARHEESVREHRRYFDRVTLALASNMDPAEPTDVWLQRMRRQPDASIYEKAFHYGRYLLIASSRPGGLPVNVQGIWNEDIQPAWNADYHLDVNLEMMYWPAEVCNLSELTDPLLRFTDSMIARGRQSAADIFGCRGIVFPIATDPYTGGTMYPGQWVAWTGAAAWIAQHYWWHWEYTGDEQFLRTRAYPFLREVARFYADFAYKDDTGTLQTLPGLSPEQAVDRPDGSRGAVARTPTIDIALMREIFSRVLLASDVLRIDREEQARWRALLDALPAYPIDHAGMLLEYPPEFRPADPQHRHLSHLLGLFPGEDIVPDVSPPALVQAARLALEQRGTLGAGGWATLFRAACWARVHEGDKALACLDQLIRTQVAPNLLGLIDAWDGVTTDPRPIQLDCSFGISAVIAEMLLQSHAGSLRFLPALPTSWADGAISGLRARGGFEVGLAWSRGVLQRATVRSHLGRRCRLRSPLPLQIDANGVQVRAEARDPGVLEFPTRAGATYTIVPRG